MKKVTALAFLNQVLMPYFVCRIYICIISNTTTVKAHMLENKNIPKSVGYNRFLLYRNVK